MGQNETHRIGPDYAAWNEGGPRTVGVDGLAAHGGGIEGGGVAGADERLDGPPDFWFLAVFGGIERSEPAVLRAESLGCDSLGWSAQRAAPGPLTQRTCQP